MSEALTHTPPIANPGAQHDHLWVDEQIWGHRLWNDQSPWLVFLEFLSVAEGHHADGHLLEERTLSEGLNYRPAQRLHLRNILYNDETIHEIARRIPSDAHAWAEWISRMKADAQGVDQEGFEYLQRRFGSFRKFASLVAMIQGSTIKPGNTKRWSSRFVFPFGSSAIYEDLNIKKGSASREYIYFGRTGEILYRMLARSSAAPDLIGHLQRMLERPDPCERLVAMMQPKGSSEPRSVRGKESYLPFEHHPSFDMLGEDWLSILKLDLPRYDAYPHLITLSSLHLALYQLKVASSVIGKSDPFFVCEIVAPRKTLVRELSVTSYINNDRLTLAAVETFIGDLAETDEWKRAEVEAAGFETCREILRREVSWPEDADDYDGAADPAMLLKTLRRRASDRHRRHAALVHRSFGGGCGLVSRRGTNRLRYAPTDELLKALILANVPVRMEYGEFLALLHRKYGLVFGDREARPVLDPEEYDQRAFEANSARLEGRLKTLGMLRRLSDACAYVENPLRRDKVA
ncbi:hypothetical protein [Aurantimonas coralicida]|uniref:hypothetical protein n=1 Tax=Aurantimonas coralicida TaxID=182270 RepID=UPI0017BD8686|nr:hypothetical protein [Aurantimonas coralicida]MCC4298501.1 hypothetical protein [Aurantimonas coralicida]